MSRVKPRVRRADMQCVALRDTIRRNAQPSLAPGEQIQAVVPAQLSRPGPYSGAIGGHLTLVATDRRILVCKSGIFRITPITKVLGEMPRDTRIGPLHGIWYRCEGLPLGFPLWIHRRFKKDVEAADAGRPSVATSW